MIYNTFDEFKDRKIEKIYDVSDVIDGYYYWFWKLFNFCLTMFEYKNLPDSLPAREIESNLLMTGHCVVFPDMADIVTACTSLYGFDRYYNPTNAIFANVKMRSKNLNIGENCEIIYNSSLKDNVLYIKSDSSMMSFIKRYSRMLADVESSMDIYMVNSRLTSFPVASSDSVMQNLKLFFKKLKRGERGIISDDSIIQQFRSVDISKASVHDGVNDWLVARDKILEMFFRDIGVKFYNPKKAQVSEDELQVNNQMLVISLDDMLKERQRGIERVNNLFATNISVDIAEPFKVKEEVMEDEKTYDRTISE